MNGPLRVERIASITFNDVYTFSMRKSKLVKTSRYLYNDSIQKMHVYKTSFLYNVCDSSGIT